MHIIPRIAIATGILAFFGAVQVVSAQSGSELAQKKFCLACHNMSQKKVGPAFNDVAKKYRAVPDAEAKLAGKIRQGSNGAWGQVPMPPQKALSDAEIKTLTAWVLSLP